MSSNEILREFLLETHENLASLDADLLTLEQRPTEKNTLAQVFRTLHSVKGTAGFMGLVKLQAVAHASESLLSRIRGGELQFSPAIATALLRVVDAIREILAQIEASGGEGDGDYAALTAELDRLRAAGDDATTPPLPPVVELPVASSVTPTPMAVQPDSTTDLSISLRPAAVAAPLVPPAPRPPAPRPPASAAPVQSPVAPVAAPPLTEELTPAAAVETHSSNLADTSIRVDVQLLDQLMTLMGELVLARNQILQYSLLQEDGDFRSTVQKLNLLTSQLQASVMKTRMQPIGNLLGKFPRIVRDLALACGKQAHFEMEGQETELDKTLLEAIRDPLTHLVRNAIDHGIEPPEVRTARGKPAAGRLRMLAFHEGGKVIVELSDDGGGIDVARVRDKAVQANLVTPEAAGRMSRQELLQLIFLPGFSTAEQVTQYSGRGVGMDVVRTSIEKIGGTVDLESNAGQGTTLRAKIPLTLAIIPALIIVSGGDRYAIPQVNLLELVWLESDPAKSAIEWLHGAPVYRLRGTLLPLVFLNELLQLEASPSAQQDAILVVLQADERPFGLVVDGIRDTEEIVVKPLQKQLQGIAVFAGAAILGDGRVALVLEVLNLAQRANVFSGAKSRALPPPQRSPHASTAKSDPLLLFALDAGGQMAIPLSQVARLEEFPRTQLESLGRQQVVQYRGELLSLIDVSRALDRLQIDPLQRGDRSERIGETVPVIVYTHATHPVGLMVGKILNVVSDPISTRSPVNRPGVLFTAVVQEQATEIIDVPALLASSTPS